MRNLSTCVYLVGVLGLVAACSKDNGASANQTGASGGNDSQSSGSTQENNQGTQAGGNKSTSGTNKGAGGSTSTKKTSTTNSTANGGSGNDSGGAGSGDTTSESGGSSVADTSDSSGGNTAAGTSKSSTSRGGKTGAGGSSGSGTKALGGGGGTKAVGGSGTKASGGSGASPAGGTSSSGSSSDAELAKSQCNGKPGPSYDDFFSESKVATLKVTIDSAALGGKTPVDALWGKKNHCPPHDASGFLNASFSYESPDSKGNVTCDKVGIRFRGSRSREETAMYTQIQGFKLDMQVLDTAATTHRRFADLNRINILSIEMDDKSHMMQCLSYKVMRDFKIPAPRCNHLKVYINGTYYGLMENIEQVNKGYARRHFGSNEGVLIAASPSMSDCSGSYKFDDSKAKLTYSGDAFSGYSTQYMVDSGTTADAEKTLIPMLKCADPTQTADDAKFKTCIQEWINVDEWLRVIAAESVMPELESWIGYYRNYYLYFNPDSSAPHGGRFEAWVWDLDTAFHKNSCYPSSCDPFTSVDSLYGPLNARAKFVTRLTSVFKSEYCTLLKSFLSTVFKPTVVDTMAKVIEGSVSGDPHTNSSSFSSEVSTLKSHFSSQATKVQTAINSACQ